jgi:hypothetical protein
MPTSPSFAHDLLTYDFHHDAAIEALCLDEWLHPDAYDTTPTSPLPDLSLSREPTPSDSVSSNPLSLCVTPPEPSLPQPPPPDSIPRRSPSKRNRTDTGFLSLTTKKSTTKRQKQITNGFPCRQETCDALFNRGCDEAKHFQRTHAPKDTLPHSCPECGLSGIVKRFMYPKDVRRHLRQVHRIEHHAAEHTPSLSLDPTAREKLYPDSSKALLPTTTTKTKTKTTTRIPTTPPSIWSLTHSLISLRKLSLKAKSPSSPSPDDNDRFIMVTTDQERFLEVDVSAITAPDALLRHILAALDLHSLEPCDIAARVYARRNRVVRLGDVLGPVELMRVVERGADAQGALKVFVSWSGGGVEGGGG